MGESILMPLYVDDKVQAAGGSMRRFARKTPIQSSAEETKEIIVDWRHEAGCQAVPFILSQDKADDQDKLE